jgi:hypothetical protein
MPNPPQYIRLWKSGFLKVLLATLPLLLAVGLVARPILRAASESNPVSTQTVFFAYWSVEAGFRSSVVLNNASVTQLTVQPTLYNLSGQPLTVSPIVLGPRQEVTANIADWLAQSGAGDSYNQGSLSLSYDAPDANYLGSQLSVVNAALSVSFDVPSENAATERGECGIERVVRCALGEYSKFRIVAA